MSFSSQQLREKYINFFKKHNHVQVESSSTIPDKNDQTVLFTTAGMQQFVPNLMGTPHKKGKKLMSVQKCVRTVDIDEVGDNRHLTFFEMLGNWSLGDYFKKEAIEWSYEFLITELGIPKHKLWVTVYGGDESIPYDQEAHNFWKAKGIPEERIVGIGAPVDPEKRRRKGRGDNFWGPAGPTGPCGPSTEMFIWLGKGDPKAGQTPETDEDNFIEVWNDVFMEFSMDENKEVTPLSQKNVDTGMGLERLTMIMQNKTTVFETDIYNGIITKLENLSKKKYPPYLDDLNEHNPITRAFRVIADHVRCSAHLIADGVAPSNEGRGYVLRRLLRRAILFGKNIGIIHFLEKVSEIYIAEYETLYPELGDRKQVIFDALKIEEENFLRTLEKGEKKLNELLLNTVIDGKKAFLLSDTYGFPKDLTRELVEEKGFTIEKEKFDQEFEAELKAQRERSRASANFERKGEENSIFDDFPATEFIGDTGENLTNVECNIVGFIIDDEDDLKGRVILDKTPFYPEGGGQVGDRGIIEFDTVSFKITDTKKLPSGTIVHYMKSSSGPSGYAGKFPEVGVFNECFIPAKASVDRNLRARTTSHHSAAHLLQSALIEVLGEGIEQAGSLVDENRTRFDFSYPKALSDKVIRTIEEKISEYVLSSSPVLRGKMTLNQAKEKGAIALFSEKYGDTVRTIQMGQSSFELCGGTHVQNTSEIGAVKILSENSVASGIRRIEMVVGENAQQYLWSQNTVLKTLSTALKTPVANIPEKIEKILQEKKSLLAQIQEYETTLLAFEAEEFFARRKEINGITIICEPVPSHDMKKVAGMARALSNKKVDIVSLFTEDGGLAIATQKNGNDAREIFKKIQNIGGGNGGGSPFFVQGKGVNLENFREIRTIVEEG